MQFNVAQMLKESIGSARHYEVTDDAGDLDPEMTLLGPLVGDVHLTRIHSGILVQARLSTAVQVMCNRCLEPIATPVWLEVEESFRPLTEVYTGRYIAPDEFEGQEEELEDEALIITEQHILDLSEVVRQEIWLALPMYPNCNWTGPEECPNFVAYQKELATEADIETTDGSVYAEPEEVDPRWAALLALRSEQEDQE